MYQQQKAIKKLPLYLLVLMIAILAIAALILIASIVFIEAQSDLVVVAYLITNIFSIAIAQFLI